MEKMILTHKLKNRISAALESLLGEIYEEQRIASGDITPGQYLEWERLTEETAALFAELIEQNKPAPRAGDLRIMYNGFSYEVQRWSARNYDGYYCQDWHTLHTFDSEPAAREYLEVMGK